jgi:hypothetical protein
MKKYLCVVLLIIISVAKASQHDWDFEYWTQAGYKFSIGPVTYEQAKQAIINWSGRQNLNIELLPIYCWERPRDRDPVFIIESSRSISSEYISWYSFAVEDPNPDHKYSGIVYVDSYTGAVKGIELRNPTLHFGQIADMLTPEQAINLAREAASSYFPNVPVNSLPLSFTLPSIDENGGTWKEYGETITVCFANRFVTSQGEHVWLDDVQAVDVEIDSLSGQPIEIDCYYEPLEISPQPSLSKEELAQAAASYLYGLGATCVEIDDIGEFMGCWRITREEPYGQQRLLTSILVYIEGIPQLPAGRYLGFIDGHTGEIRNAILPIPMGPTLLREKRKNWDNKKPAQLGIFFNGKRAKIFYPPIVWNGKVYVSGVDLEKMGFHLKKEKGAYKIYLKSKFVTLKGLDVIRKGKLLYVLGEKIGGIKGVLTSFNKNRNKFYIVVLDEKAFSKGREDRMKLKKECTPG